MSTPVSRPAQDYLLLPVLLILHVVFSLASLTVRIIEATQTRVRHNGNMNTAARAQALRGPPSHIALVLVPSRGRQKQQEAALVESVRRAVEWAGESGVQELSVWDGQGEFCQMLNHVKQPCRSS
jgi:hypothetical protein